METIKAKYPATRSASVLAQPDTPYDVLVQVMDAVRQAKPKARRWWPRTKTA